MSTPLDESTDIALENAQKSLAVFDLDKALEAIDQSLKKRQQDSGSDLSFYGNLLWCKILLAKGRFLKDKHFPTLALSKLLELQSLFPQINNTQAVPPFKLLIGEAYSQLREVTKAKEVYQDNLKQSQQAEHIIGIIQALNGLVALAFDTDEIEHALNLANQSLELLIQHTDEANYPDLVANYLLQSKIFLKKRDLSQAKNYAERALVISEERGYKELVINAHILLGKVANELKTYPDAISYLLRAKADSLAINYQVATSEALLYMGITYNHVFHYPKALENFKQVEALYIDLLNKEEQILLLNYLGKSHLLSHENQEAKNYFLSAENLAKKSNNQAALVFSLAYLGVIYSREDSFNRALRYAKRVNSISQEIGDVDGIQINLINLGNVHNKLEKYSESIKLTSRGIAAAKRMKDGLSEIRGYQIMAEIFRKKKEYKSAVMYQMIYTKFYEDFYQRNDRQKVSEIEHQFTVSQLEERIQALKVTK